MKQRDNNLGFVPAILLIGALVLLGGVAFVVINSGWRPWKISTTNLTIKTAYPWENNQLDKLSYTTSEDMSGKYVTDFHRNTQQVFDSDLLPMECLSPVGSAYLSQDGYAQQISDKTVVSLMDQLKAYKFPSSDNPSQRFTRDISYMNICKAGGRYVLFFSSNGEGVNSGHGGYDPVSLAYTDGNGGLVVSSDFSDCLKLIGITAKYAYLSCGWGDGPGGWSSIDRVSFSNSNKQTIVKCETDMEQPNDNIQRCYDSNNSLYYSSSK